MQSINQKELTKKIPTVKICDGSVFGALSTDTVDFLLSSGNLIALNEGDRLFSVGDKGNHFFIILEGSIDFIKHHKGKSATTRTANFGESLAFPSMIALHDHTGEAVANQGSIVLEISARLFSELQEKYQFDFGILTLNLARDMARNIRKLNNALVKKSN